MAALAALVSMISVHREAHAAWPSDPAVNVAVCDTAGDTRWEQMVADGGGGLVAGWRDTRRGPEDFRLNRVNSAGMASAGWPNCGLIAASNYVGVSEGASLTRSLGDAVVAVWFGMADAHAHAQRIDTSGVAQWGPNGTLVPISRFGSRAVYGGVPLPDGGVMVFWRNEDLAYNDTLFAMRIDGSGHRAWSEDKVVVDAPGRQMLLVATAVSDSEVVATWMDARTTPGHFDPQVNELYGQKLGISGVEQWGSNGKRILTQGWWGRLAANGRGGFVGCYVTYENDNGGDLKLVNIGASGDPLPGWPANGITLAAVPGAWEWAAPISVSPTDGSVMVSWWDSYAAGGDVFVQKVDTSGVLAWPAGPRVVFHPTGSAAGFTACGDGEGGLFVCLSAPDRKSVV